MLELMLSECEDCRKKLMAMKMQIDIQSTNIELKSNPLKKVRFYQKMLMGLGAVIAFILGACIPIAILGLTVLERGEIAIYQIERVKSLWYVLASGYQKLGSLDETTAKMDAELASKADPKTGNTRENSSDVFYDLLSGS